MNLNGGYIMLDLDDTSGLLDRVKKVYDSGKPLVVKYDGRLQFANFAKRATSTSNFDITLSDNTKLDIHYNSGALVIGVVTQATKYRHLSAFTITEGGVNERKLITEVISNSSTKYTNVTTILAGLYNAGYKSETTMTLCLYDGNYAQVYVTSSGSGYTLHYKPSGATGFTTVSGGTFVSDNVTEI